MASDVLTKEETEKLWRSCTEDNDAKLKATLLITNNGVPCLRVCVKDAMHITRCSIGSNVSEPLLVSLNVVLYIGGMKKVAWPTH